MPTALDDFDRHIEQLLEDRARTMKEFTAGHRPLNMYAIYRADLEMPPEKLAAQCGHAFARAYENACQLDPEIGARYKGTGNGTKICMYAKNQGQLLRAYRDMLEQGVPCELIIDRGHVLLPHFTGAPIITALGIGPVYRDTIANTLKRYSMTKAIAS